MVNDKSLSDRSKVHLTLLVVRGEGKTGLHSPLFVCMRVCVLLWMSKLFQNTATHVGSGTKTEEQNNQRFTLLTAGYLLA